MTYSTFRMMSSCKTRMLNGTIVAMDQSWDALKTAFATRLREAMQGASINAFARKAGLSASSVHRILHGGEPSLSTIFQLADAANVSANWLMTGRDPQNTQIDYQSGTQLNGFANDAAPTQLDANFSEVVIRSLPAHGLALNGTQYEASQIDAVRFPKAVLNDIGITPDRACLAQVFGTSMEPLIRDGSVVLIDTADRHLAEGRIYAFQLNGAFMIKRLRPGRNGLVIIPENRRLFSEELITESDDFELTGRVRWAGQIL